MILKLRRESKGNDLTRKRWRDFESSKESLSLSLMGEKIHQVFAGDQSDEGETKAVWAVVLERGREGQIILGKDFKEGF